MKELCRLCLMSKKDDHQELDQQLNLKILECVKLDIAPDSDLPALICALCLKCLTDWEEFKEKCHQSNEVLNKSLIYPVDIESASPDKSEYEENNHNAQSNTAEEEIDKVNHLHDVCNVYTCEICSQTFDSCFDYLDHQYQHDGNLAFKCNQCEKVYSNRNEFVQHKNNHPTVCSVCGKCVLMKSLRIHMIQHSDKYKCSKCPKSFNSSTTLSSHYSAVHTAIRDHVCDLCGQCFSTKTSLTVHRKIHSNERLYKCNYCPHNARTSNAIYAHQSTHRNDKCLCEICSKIFKNLRSLRDHVRRTHCNEKLHKCPHCTQAFTEGYKLKIHMRRHLDDRSFKCKICGKSFIRSDSLKEHVKLHSERVLIDCIKCQRQYSTKRGLARHVCVTKLI